MADLLWAWGRELACLLLVVAVSLGMLSCLLVARLAGGGVPPRLVRRLVVEVWLAGLGACVFLSAAWLVAEQYLAGNVQTVVSGAAIALCLLLGLLVLRRVNRAMRGHLSAGPGER